jgi:PhnB protein
MKIEPYLFFNGRCEEAIEFYRGALGASVTMLMRFDESPEPPLMPLPPEWGRKVMHAGLTIGDTTVMASDGMTDGGMAFNGFCLSIAAPDATAAQSAFDALAVGGQVRMPLGQTFWSPCFGMVADRFGVGWMVGVDASTEQPKEAKP